MSTQFRDYYAVLGVTSDASAAQIKTAFRSLARKYHPDIAKDKASAEHKFKEINEANEVLSDPDKRRKYDELGANWNHPERQTAPEGGPGSTPGQGYDFHVHGTGYSDFFEQFFGSRGRWDGDPGAGWEGDNRARADARRGRDIESDVLVTLDEVFRGSVRTIRLQRADPRSGQSVVQTLQVRIPAGVREAQLIRLAGKGQEGADGGDAGDLYLRIRLAKHPDFRVRGSDLYCSVELAPWEAVLGASVQIPTLDGMASLKIPPGTTAERVLRLRGRGLPAGGGHRGDLHATVRIQVPPQATSEQTTLWQKLAGISAFNPRDTP